MKLRPKLAWLVVGSGALGACAPGDATTTHLLEDRTLRVVPVEEVYDPVLEAIVGPDGETEIVSVNGPALPGLSVTAADGVPLTEQEQALAREAADEHCDHLGEDPETARVNTGQGRYAGNGAFIFGPCSL